MIVASVESTRQARSFVNNVKGALRFTGNSYLGIEGEHSGEWVLVDLGDLIVHIMQPEIREYYNLEDLWRESPSASTEKVG